MGIDPLSFYVKESRFPMEIIPETIVENTWQELLVLVLSGQTKK
jgi:endonuclease IV